MVFICLVRYNRFLYTWFVNINFYIRVPCSLWQVSICLVRCNRFLHVWFVITGFWFVITCFYMSQLLDRFLYICLVRYKKFLYVWFVLMGFYMNGSLWQVCLSLAYFDRFTLSFAYYDWLSLSPVYCDQGLVRFTPDSLDMFSVFWLDLIVLATFFFGLIWSPRGVRSFQ